MKLAVDVEVDGDLATFLWPVEHVVLDAAGITALVRDLVVVRAQLDAAAGVTCSAWQVTGCGERAAAG